MIAIQKKYRDSQQARFQVEQHYDEKSLCIGQIVYKKWDFSTLLKMQLPKQLKTISSTISRTISGEHKKLCAAAIHAAANIYLLDIVFSARNSFPLVWLWRF